MAHEFDSGFFYQKPAWHRLGTVVNEQLTTREAIVAAGMNWEVLEVPIFANSNILLDGTIAPWLVDPDIHTIPDKKALIRSDTGRTLHVCNTSWTVLQNEKAFTWFDPLIQDGDVYLDAAISLQEGKRIAITAKIKDGVGSVLPGDDVELYIILYNSHDGTLQVGMMFSTIRAVCANTLGAAISDRKRKGDYAQFEKGDDLAVTAKSVRAKHTKNLHQNMALVQGTIDVAKRNFGLTLEQYRSMAKTPMNEALFREYLCRVYDYNVEMKPNAQGKTIKDMRGYNQLLKNFEAGVGIDIKGVEGTLWQGYQAVTQHITHAKDGSDIEDQRKRLNQLLFGTAADLTQKAHNVAVEMIAR